MATLSVASILSLCNIIYHNAQTIASELEDVLSKITSGQHHDDRAGQLSALSGKLRQWSTGVQRLQTAVSASTELSQGLQGQVAHSLEACQAALTSLGVQVKRLQPETLPLLNGLYVTAHSDAFTIYTQLLAFLKLALSMTKIEEQEAVLNVEEGRRLTEQAEDALKMITKGGEILIDGDAATPVYSSSSTGKAGGASSSKEKEKEEKEASEHGPSDKAPPPTYEQAAAGAASSTKPGSSSSGEGRLQSLKHSFQALTFNLFSKPEPLASALCEASRRGDKAQVEALLKQPGVDADGRNQEGTTPLTCAINANHRAIARLLIDAGAGFQSGSGMPPMFLAAATGALEIADMLYDRGGPPANVRGESLVGQPHFIDALDYGSAEGVRWLLDRGADPRAESITGQPAVVRAAEKGSVEMVDALLQAGAKVTSGDNCLMNIALEKPDTRLMQLLIEHGVKLSSRTSDDERVLAKAIRKKRYAHAKCLLEAGADGNIEDEDEVKAIIAVLKEPWKQPAEQAEMVRLLLQNGAKTNSKDSAFRTPLNLAIDRGLDSQVVDVLAKHGAEVNKTLRGGDTPLVRAINIGRSDYAKVLLERGANVNAPSKDGKSPLLLALMRHDLELVRLLRRQHGAVLDDAAREFAWKQGEKSTVVQALDMDDKQDQTRSADSQDPEAGDLPPSYDAVTAGGGGGGSSAAEQSTK